MLPHSHFVHISLFFFFFLLSLALIPLSLTAFLSFSPSHTSPSLILTSLLFCSSFSYSFPIPTPTSTPPLSLSSAHPLLTHGTHSLPFFLTQRGIVVMSTLNACGLGSRKLGAGDTLVHLEGKNKHTLVSELVVYIFTLKVGIE